MKTVSFQTRARTVDHLGREQIADIPTAVSELWKNSYDAYAKNVSLTIFDEDPLTVAIADDGYGMDDGDITDRWLVVGTESKLFDDKISTVDMAGLKPRPRQGQKGIGRLSSAHLGSLLLLLSKRRGKDATATLIDWRLFENPFLILSDIEIPVISLSHPHDIMNALPEMVQALLENVTGNQTQDDRSKRIIGAWEAYDHITGQNASADFVKPSQIITDACNNLQIDNHHMQYWPVWGGSSDHGTLLLIKGASEEFSAFLPNNFDKKAYSDDRDRFRNTLGGFVDPLFDPARPEINATAPDLNYGVYLHSEPKSDKIIGSDEEFNRSFTDRMEHIVDGTIDEFGIFRGQIKAWGEWRKIGADYVVLPPHELSNLRGSKTKLGPIDVYIATFEQEAKYSTHSPSEYSLLRQVADKDHAGLMIYRDGLRVLPYGRIDNDFFEIEKLRSVNAGREYWNARRIFGRIAISRQNNPNLKDKAGREGFIINAAAKTLKVLIMNILHNAAYDYFGSNSGDRVSKKAENEKSYNQWKAEEDKKKLNSKRGRAFRTQLRANSKVAPKILAMARDDLSQISLSSANDIPAAQIKLEEIQQKQAELRLPSMPNNLGTVEQEYRNYRQLMTELNELVASYSEKLSEAIERIDPPSPEEILHKQIQRNMGQLSSRITRWSKEIAGLQTDESHRIETLVSERNKLFRQETTPLIEQIIKGRVSLSTASKKITEIKNRIDNENQLLFENYILALESMKENIDLQNLALLSGDENSDLRSEVDRLNGLAQMGISIEILDHEFHSHNQMISSSIKRIEADPTDTSAIDHLKTGYAGLRETLDFLQPLRMAGQRESRRLSGRDIYDYTRRFFDRTISNNGIHFDATPRFCQFQIIDQPSRIYPVFINLINNSLYWVINSDTPQKRVLLDVIDDEIIVADSGPGIDEIDYKRLFTLFFTRKISGGRGIGLYLCRANLAAGGHSIRYIQNDKDKVLPGANFAIKFRGVEFND